MLWAREHYWKVATFLVGATLMFAYVQYALYSPSALACVLALPPAVLLARLIPRLRNSGMREPASPTLLAILADLRASPALPVLAFLPLYLLVLFLPMPLLAEVTGTAHWRQAQVETWDSYHHAGKTTCTHVRARLLDTPRPARLSHCLRERVYDTVPAGATIEVATYESVLGVMVQRRVKTRHAPLPQD